MRQSRLRTVFGGPQGEKASITLVSPTMGEVKALQKLVKEASQSSDDEAEKNLEISNKYLSDHIVAWNWVNDDEEVFELPKVNPEVLDLLTIEEIKFINDSLVSQVPYEIENRKK